MVNLEFCRHRKQDITLQTFRKLISLRNNEIHFTIGFLFTFIFELVQEIINLFTSHKYPYIPQKRYSSKDFNFFVHLKLERAKIWNKNMATETKN